MSNTFPQCYTKHGGDSKQVLRNFYL
ncbi:hypothetical protein EMIT0P228_90116 [Pseudomonas brassicacearum]